MADKKATTYIALIGFSVKGERVAMGDKCPSFDAELTQQLVNMKRMAKEGSDEAKAVIATAKANKERYEADRKAAEAKGRLPGTK